MAWRFPDGVFDLVTAGGEYINCRLIEADADTLTVDRDYVMGFGRILRLRTQIRLEDVRAVHEHAPVVVAADPPRVRSSAD